MLFVKLGLDPPLIGTLDTQHTHLSHLKPNTLRKWFRAINAGNSLVEPQFLGKFEISKSNQCGCVMFYKYENLLVAVITMNHW